mmetsp:Transcript_5325/g.7533  ORF Transcript_5325/g.7533 Transcript_5325/m.7533 type:complete len:347 (-) Transcript_5325:88-1128(-)
MLFHFTSLLLALATAGAIKTNEIKRMPEHTILNDYENPLPHSYLNAKDLPDAFTWANVDGVSYLTHSLNQHLPQYCGSCWAHGAISAFSDRIKIAREAKGEDINLSIQFILNCGADMAGSCHGGYHTGVYEFIKKTGYVPYDTCNPYIACSADSTEGFCPHVDTTCTPINTCRTCDTFGSLGGGCTEIDYFPNATVAEYGIIEMDADAIMSEIYTRGPVAAVINAEPIVDYKGGIFTDTSFSQESNHIVSIVGWGKDEESGKQHWIIRNSWGEYWGEMGFMRLEIGQNLLGIESEVAWVTPGTFSVENYACAEDGKNCDHGGFISKKYVDPSSNIEALESRLRGRK